MQQKGMTNRTKLRILAVSDTHGEYYTVNNLSSESGDILIIGEGDFTYYGMDSDFDKFFDFLDSLKNWKHKIVIAGNHEIVLDENLSPQIRKKFDSQFPCKYSRQFIEDQLRKRAIYLKHQYVQVQGLKIFGSPYTTFYCGSAFQIVPKQLEVLWREIPNNLDILITHGPPLGIRDLTSRKKNAGCKYLLEKVKQVKPKIHLFGHIHQGRAGFGQCTYTKAYQTRFYNIAQKPVFVEFQQDQ